MHVQGLSVGIYGPLYVQESTTGTQRTDIHSFRQKSSNKSTFELLIHQSFMDLNSMTVFNIDNYEMLSVISEGSCDTEDWSNDAENSALTTQE